MNEQNKHIDDIFREALGNYAETPPAGVWNDIEQRLPGTPKRPRGFGGWMWGVVLLLLVSGGLLVARKMLHKNLPAAEKRIAQTTTAHSSTDNNNTISTGTKTQNTTSQPDSHNTPNAAKANSSNASAHIAPANSKASADTTSAATSIAKPTDAGSNANRARNSTTGSGSKALVAVHSKHLKHNGASHVPGNKIATAAANGANTAIQKTNSFCTCSSTW